MTDHWNPERLGRRGSDLQSDLKSFEENWALRAERAEDFENGWPLAVEEEKSRLRSGLPHITRWIVDNIWSKPSEAPAEKYKNLEDPALCEVWVSEINSAVLRLESRSKEAQPVSARFAGMILPEATDAELRVIESARRKACCSDDGWPCRIVARSRKVMEISKKEAWARYLSEKENLDRVENAEKEAFLSLPYIKPADKYIAAQEAMLGPIAKEAA